MKNRHYPVFGSLLYTIFFFSSLTLYSQTHTPLTININSNTRGFYQYLPVNYTSSSEKFPLILYMGGYSTLGNGSTSDLQRLLTESVPYYINTGQFPSTFTINNKTYSFIVISPQFISWPTYTDVQAVIDYLFTHGYKIDRSRVYLTGYSMGGDVTWKYPNQSLANAKKLAAIGPVAGAQSPYNDNGATYFVQANVAAWAFHSNSDDLIPVSLSQNYVNKINSLNPAIPAIITRFNGISHDSSWRLPYNPSWRGANGLNMYEWFLQYSIRNTPPTANAGANMTITLPANSVVLNGSASADADGIIAGYQWTKISGPAGATFSSSNTVSTTFSNLVEGVYQVELAVVDDSAAVSKDTVQVTVSPTPVLRNIKVNVYGGTNPYNTGGWNNWNVSSRLNSGILNYDYGSASGISAALSYSQSVVNNGTNYGGTMCPPQVLRYASYSSASSRTLTISGLNNGYTYDIELYASRAGTGNTARFTINGLMKSVVTDYNLANKVVFTDLVPAGGQIVVTISKQSSAEYLNGFTIIENSLPAPNQLPDAQAGNDVALTLPGNSVQLSGSNSNDPDGSIVSYNWTKVAGPSQFAISNAAVVNPLITNLVEGTYVFELLVRDNRGGEDKDSLTLVVSRGPNQVPVAIAGIDQTIFIPASSVTLNGSSSTDADGNISSYLWTKISGPDGSAFTSAGSASTGFTNLVEGVYLVELMVTDDSAAIDRDTVQIAVTTAPPLPTKYVKVNLYGGSNAYNSGGWNNWNVTGSNVSNLNSPVFNYDNAVSSGIAASLSFSQTVSNNGTTYGGTMCPPQVLRYASTSNAALRTLTIRGLNNSFNYHFELYSSRAGTGNSTRFTINGLSRTVLSDYNLSNKIIFTNIRPVNGQVVITITRLNALDHLNGFMIIENPAVPPPNQLPVAIAGTDQVITLPVNSVQLNGSVSFDGDGTVTNYQWVKIAGPEAHSVANPFAAITGVNNLVSGVYRFQLTVTDDQGAFARDTVAVIVNPAAVTDSLNCGITVRIVVLGSSTAYGVGPTSMDSAWAYRYNRYIKTKNISSQVINLAESATTTYEVLCPTGFVPPAGKPSPLPDHNITKALSYNPDAIIINLPTNDASWGFSLQEQQDNYERAMKLADERNIPVWVTTTQPRSDLTTAQRNNLVSMRDWTYQRFGNKAIDFWTTLANADGTINSAYNSGDGIHLNNAGHRILYSRTVSERILDTLCLRMNTLPVANAGSDLAMSWPVNAVSLNGSASVDPDGSVIGYTWTKIAGPSQYNISNSSISNPPISNLLIGVYQFELVVADNKGATDRDTVVVTVTTGTNQLPVAHAGTDDMISLPANTVQLNGSGSNDPDGNITAYRWTKADGPLPYAISDATIVNPVIGGLAAGRYIFELTVTDNSGSTSKDSVTITVNRGPNQLPVANAGLNQIIALPVNSVALNAGGSSDDGAIVNYQWTKISGPSQFSFSNANSASTNFGNLVQGVYLVELIVTDDSSAVAKDTVEITVNAAPPVTTRFIRVNLYGGTNPYNSGGWNNWNLNGTDIANANAPIFNYDDGSASSVNATLSYSQFIVDNGASYGGNMCPPQVLRYASYSSASSRTLTIKGLNNAYNYDIEFYASRSNTGNSTRFTINGVNATVVTDNNLSNKAVFTDIVPSSGQIVVTVTKLNTAEYLNGFMITEKPRQASRVQRDNSETTAPEDRNAISIFPNPYNTQVRLIITDHYRGNLVVQIFDLNGKLLKQLPYIKAAEHFSKNISLDDLRQGSYILKVQTSKGSYTRKLMKIM